MSLILDHVDKSFETVQALRQVHFEVQEGELFGLIGPDGAGKSTLFRIMASLLVPDAGSCSMLGYDVVRDYRKVRQIIGYMPGRFSLYMDLSVEENLAFYARVFGTTVREHYDLIKDVYEQIAPFKKRLAGRLSGGMKQKLALSCALIHRPRVLILDEPTTGVDAVSRQEFWEMLKKIQQEGITIMVSTPYMDEVARCDRAAFIFDGRKLSEGTPRELASSFKGQIFFLDRTPAPELVQKLNAIEGLSAQRFGAGLHLSLGESGNLEDYAGGLQELDISIDDQLSFREGLDLLCDGPGQGCAKFGDALRVDGKTGRCRVPAKTPQ